MNPRLPTPLLQMHVEGLIHNELVLGDRQMPNDPREQLSIQIQRRLPIVLWTLIQQPLADVVDRPPPREHVRRAKKEGRTRPPSNIRIVNLRRAKGPSTPHPDVEHNWTHQWIVSGHWRNQWLASVKEHRLQWIAPYVKGPADKPLIVKKTVHRLVR